MSIEQLREANNRRSEDEAKNRKHQEQLDTSKSLESTLFQGFQSLVSVLEGENSKAEAIGLIVTMLDKLEKSGTDNKTDIGVIKSGLKTLEEQIGAIPTDSLKKIPKFLEQREDVKVTNFADLKEWFGNIEKAIKQLKLDVKAPVVNVEAPKVSVPTPIVNVPEMSLKPLESAISEVTKAVKASKPELKDGAIKTYSAQGLINEPFDEYKLVYKSTLDDDAEPVITAITYWNSGKKVATLKYTYDREGNLTGGKRV